MFSHAGVADASLILSLFSLEALFLELRNVATLVCFFPEWFSVNLVNLEKKIFFFFF